eukprot:GHVS01035186.1.p1 GENE.GHVS01035186.1~~GHVS01035186.1.p1  ORF type:complete len:229 (+),score=35.90 GHVS01035186.1:246-932(+)
MGTSSDPFVDVKRLLKSDGFAVCRQLFLPSAMTELRHRCAELVEAFQPDEAHCVFSTAAEDRTSDRFFMSSGDVIRFFLEKNVQKQSGELNVDKLSAINKIGHGLHEQDDVFRRFSTRPEILRLCDSIGYKKPTIIQSMYILKQPHTGGPVHPHQDGCFLFSEPQTVMGAWFAIDAATKHNGCLYIVPGSHVLLPRLGRYRRLSDHHCGFDVEPTYSTEGAGGVDRWC